MPDEHVDGNFHPDLDVLRLARIQLIGVADGGIPAFPPDRDRPEVTTHVQIVGISLQPQVGYGHSVDRCGTGIPHSTGRFHQDLHVTRRSRCGKPFQGTVKQCDPGRRRATSPQAEGKIDNPMGAVVSLQPSNAISHVVQDRDC